MIQYFSVYHSLFREGWTLHLSCGDYDYYADYSLYSFHDGLEIWEVGQILGGN